MENRDSNQLYAHFLKILHTRKWQILLCMLAVLAPIVAYNELATPVYESSVSIIFDQASSSLTSYDTDPLRKYYRETSILNRIEEIESRSLAEEVAEELSPELIERFQFPDEPPPGFDRDDFIVDKIKESLSASVVRQTDVVKISVETHDPQLSQTIGNLAASALRERNLRIKRDEVSGVREVIEEQLSVFQEQLEEAEQKLRDFKEKEGITSLEMQTEEILKRITECEVLANEVKAELSAKEQRYNVIKQKLSSQKQDLLPSVTNVASPWFESQKDRLTELQVQITRLRVQDYPSDHPKMVQLQDEFNKIKESLTQEIMKVTEGEFVSDPLTQLSGYVTESISLEIELQALRAQQRACSRVVSDYEERLKELPDKELKLANLVRKREVNEKIYMMLYEKREEAKISEAERAANIRIIDNARLPEQPIHPNKTLNLALGIVMGLALGFGLAFFQETLHRTLKTSEDIEELTSWPVLANVPTLELNKKSDSEIDVSDDPRIRRGMLTILEPKSMSAEAFRVLRTNIQFRNENRKYKTILTSSLSAAEGKSTTTTNLAISLTKLGLRVLIIDADLRRPTMHELLEVDKQPGLGDILSNHQKLVNDLVAEDREKEFYENATDSPVWSSIQNLKNHDRDVVDLVENFQDFSMEESNNDQAEEKPKSQYINFLNVSLIESIQSTKIKNLKVLSSGKALDNPSELVSTNSMKWLLEVAKKKYDFVLVDSPPLLLVPDCMVLSRMVDGVMLVLEADKNEQKMLLRVKQFLDKTQTRVLGVVLNRVDPKTMYSDEDYYYFG